MNVYTKARPELIPLVRAIIKEKGLEDNIGPQLPGHQVFSFLFIRKKSHIGAVKSGAHIFDGTDYTEVKACEFLKALDEFQPKNTEKSIEFEIGEDGEMAAKIYADRIEIGCQEYSMEQFAEIEKALHILQKGEIVLEFPGKRKILVQADAIIGAGELFTLADYRKVKAAIEEISK